MPLIRILHNSNYYIVLYGEQVIITTCSLKVAEKWKDTLIEFVRKYK